MSNFFVPLVGGFFTVFIIFLTNVPAIGFLAAIFIAMPSSVILLNWGLSKAIQSLILGAIFALALFGTFSISIILLIGISLTVLKVTLERGGNLLSYSAIASAAVLLIFFAFFYYLEFVAGKPIGSQFSNFFVEGVAEVKKTYLEMGVPEKKVDQAIGQLNAAIQTVENLIPAIYAVTFMVFLLANFFLSKLAAKRADSRIVFSPLKDWDIHWVFSWGYIAGLAIQLFGGNLPGLVKIAGLNLLAFFGVIFIFQGVAVVAHFFAKWKISKLGKIAAIVVMLIVPLILQLISLLGLFDVWFNYRKLKRAI